MTLTVDDILCPRCDWFRGFVDKDGRFFVDCAYNRLVEPRVTCMHYDLMTKDCKKCSPVTIGWCTGDCKKCEKRSEWEVWAE